MVKTAKNKTSGMGRSVRINLFARQSDLSKVQAYQVGNALKSAFPTTEVKYQFLASLGDKNQDQPLWKMPEQGVFTQDFYEYLVRGEADIVVHSWKDLPIEERPETQISATLSREDQRDLVLFRKDRLSPYAGSKKLKILTSSPRRSYQLARFLPKVLPFPIDKIEWVPVRGNVQTRVKKLLDGSEDALVVAKAAIDRLLSTNEKQFEDTKIFLKQAIRKLEFMILPLSEVPTAAAQGALGIEVRRNNQSLIKMLNQINSGSDFENVKLERSLHRQRGGGCHQKYGVSVLNRTFGKIIYEVGNVDGVGEVENRSIKWRDKVDWPIAKKEDIFPSKLEAIDSIRIQIPVDRSIIEKESAFWVAHSEAAINFDFPKEAIVWTAGTSSWERLAARGVWVHGCADGLGESEDPRLNCLTGGHVQFLKLTHDKSLAKSNFPQMATYSVMAPKQRLDFSGKSHFFWRSVHPFLQAIEDQPEILNGFHACGPGHTCEVLKDFFGGTNRLRVFLSYEHWKNEILKNEE